MSWMAVASFSRSSFCSGKGKEVNRREMEERKGEKAHKLLQSGLLRARILRRDLDLTLQRLLLLLARLDDILQPRLTLLERLILRLQLVDLVLQHRTVLLRLSVTSEDVLVERVLVQDVDNGEFVLELRALLEGADFLLSFGLLRLNTLKLVRDTVDDLRMSRVFVTISLTDRKRRKRRERGGRTP